MDTKKEETEQENKERQIKLGVKVLEKVAEMRTKGWIINRGWRWWVATEAFKRLSI